MKLKRVLVIFGLSIAMLSAGIQNTYGTDEIEAVEEQAEEPAEVVEQKTAAPEQKKASTPAPSQSQTSAKAAEPAPSEASSEPAKEEKSETKVEEEKSGDEVADSKENCNDEAEGKEVDGEVADGEETDGEEGNREETGEKTDGEEADGGETGEETDGEKTDEEEASEDTSDGEDAGEETDGEKADEEEAGEDISDSEEADGKDSDKADETEEADAEVKEDDAEEKPSVVHRDDEAENERKLALRTQLINELLSGTYEQSDSFTSWCDRVKYNVKAPIDGLPSFINQEMVVGAIKSQDDYGIPASVTVAQIIQESGFGRYGQGGGKGQGLSYLAYEYNNLFGVKGSGTAGSVKMKTGEQRKDGSRYSTVAGFRVYNTYSEAIEDRAKLLTEHYSDLTNGANDANTYAMKIAGRWATSLDYGRNLIRNMKKYDLYRLDNMTLKDLSKLQGSFTNPCPGAVLTSGYGKRNAPTTGASTYHRGLDLGTGGKNLPTYAVAAGTVVTAGYSSSAGNMITIDHGNGLVTKYMHHSELYVKVGDHVEKGQQIGLSGSTGISTGNHLHFQVEENGHAVDPTSYLGE